VLSVGKAIDNMASWSYCVIILGIWPVW